jgi:hypothetical protein
MDPRARRAQQLYWEVEELRRHNAAAAALAKTMEMARLHEALSIELLEQRNPDGWPDLFAAVTAWADAGRKGTALGLIRRGQRWTEGLVEGRDNVLAELESLRRWVNALVVVPSLLDLGQQVPLDPAA